LLSASRLKQTSNALEVIDHSSCVALAMRHGLEWFIYLRV